MSPNGYERVHICDSHVCEPRFPAKYETFVKIEKLEADFKDFVGTLDEQVKAAGDKKDEIMPKLREEYGKENAKKDEAVAAVKASGMGSAKSVKALTGSKAEL